MPIEQHLKVAMKTASRSELQKKHGALLIDGDKIIAIGRNLRTWGKRRSIHAEENVLSKIPRGYKSESLMILSIRVNSFGELRMAKPCKRCTALIERSGIKMVIYTT